MTRPPEPTNLDIALVNLRTSYDGLVRRLPRDIAEWIVRDELIELDQMIRDIRTAADENKIQGVQSDA